MARTAGSVSGLSWGECRILRVPSEVNLVFDDSSETPRISSLVFDSQLITKLSEQHPEAKIRVNVERMLRRQRFDGGTPDSPKDVPIDVDTGKSTLERIGKGPRSWQVRVVDSKGFVLAQTKVRRTGKVIFDAGDPDNPLLTIAQDDITGGRAWKVDMSRAEVPQVIVHTTMDELFRHLKAEKSELFHILPQIVSEIIDYLIGQHFEGYPIDSYPRGNWQKGWVEVLTKNYENPLPELNPEDVSDGVSSLFEWKADVLDSISLKIGIRDRLTSLGGD